MQLTKQSNTAIRVLMYCAVHAPDQCRLGDIARAYGVSELSLYKFIKPLVDSGMLHTARGRQGGISLGRPADTITMRQVIEETEESFALAECFTPEGSDCPLVDNCVANRAYAEALGAFLKVLDSYTIADLIKRDKLLKELFAIDGRREGALTA